MKVCFLVIIASFSLFVCKSQSKQTDTLSLQKLIFHSGPCYGACPMIDLEIASNKSIVLKRWFYKGPMDSLRSGHFKGMLTTEDYEHIVSLLRACKIDSLKFPDIHCCDAPEITIIAYHDNRRTYLKSMFPPKEAKALISFLTKIATDYQLPRMTEIEIIEE